MGGEEGERRKEESESHLFRQFLWRDRESLGRLGKGLRGCEVMELGMQGGEKDLGGENVIRIYFMKNIFKYIC